MTTPTLTIQLPRIEQMLCGVSHFRAPASGATLTAIYGDGTEETIRPCRATRALIRACARCVANGEALPAFHTFALVDEIQSHRKEAR